MSVEVKEPGKGREKLWQEEEGIGGVREQWCVLCDFWSGANMYWVRDMWEARGEGVRKMRTRV